MKTSETARREFWEKCASRQPRVLLIDVESSLLHHYTAEDPDDVAKWADCMLAEWDKRWIADEETANVYTHRCRGCGEWLTERETGNDSHHTRAVRNEKGELEPEMCGPIYKLSLSEIRRLP